MEGQLSFSTVCGCTRVGLEVMVCEVLADALLRPEKSIHELLSASAGDVSATTICLSWLVTLCLLRTVAYLQGSPINTKGEI